MPDACSYNIGQNTVETSENNFKNKEYNCESLIKNIRLILDRM